MRLIGTTYFVLRCLERQAKRFVFQPREWRDFEISMKVEKEEKAVAVYEGGEDAAPADENKPKTRQEHYKEKYGDGYAEGLNKETGINFDRGCTDFLCVVIFLVFVSCMFAVAIFGLVKG